MRRWNGKREESIKRVFGELEQIQAEKVATEQATQRLRQIESPRPKEHGLETNRKDLIQEELRNTALEKSKLSAEVDRAQSAVDDLRLRGEDMERKYGTLKESSEARIDSIIKLTREISDLKTEN